MGQNEAEEPKITNGDGIMQFEREVVDNTNSDGEVETLISDSNGQPTQKKIIIELPGSGNEDDVNRRCGFGSFSPDWIQKFASKKSFMLVFSMLAIIQGMAWAYFTATITTLEKRFKISSQTAGIVMTGNEISQILFSIVIAYYGGRGHRPRWIAMGVLVSALSCYILASPHIFYGAGSDALSLTEEYAHLYETSKNVTPLAGASATAPTNMSRTAAALRRKVQVCRPEEASSSTLTDCEVGDQSIVPLILIFLSQFVMGIGVLLFFTLGGPYLDDNIKKTKSPMMFGITMSLRLVGPTLGFLLAGACLKTYIAPSLTPIISIGDPRFLGAWWLGWIILGTLQVVTSFFIAMFPRELPKNINGKKVQHKHSGAPNGMSGSQASLAQRTGSQLVMTAEVVNEHGVPKLSELPRALKILIKNKVNLYNNLAGVFYLFSAIGYWTYMPKYMETIFRQSAASASVISGIVSIVFQSVGLLLSGFLISRFQPSARKLAAWNVILGFMYVAVKIGFTQIGCDSGILAHGDVTLTNTGYETLNLTTSCNADCNCKVNKMFPVCYKEQNQLFYSACHAGCTSYENGTVSGCACLPSMEDTVEIGTCSEGCWKTFVIFLAINAVVKLLDSSGRIGNMLVSYRCVDPKDKSLAIGVTIFLISFLAMLPAPILFGRIIDWACLVWGTKCGGKGNCWLYDGEKLRYWFNLTAATFTLIGTLFDCLVCYYVGDLDLYDEDKNVQRRMEKQNSKKNRQNK